MTTVKRITDLTKYTSVLPYDSEMFGVYQPLLGWKSVRIENRFKDGFHRDKAEILDRLKRQFGVTPVEWTVKDYATRSRIVHLLSYAAGDR